MTGRIEVPGSLCSSCTIKFLGPAGKVVAKASGSKILLTVNPNNCTMDAVTTQSWAISLGKNYTVTSFKLNTTAGSPASPGADA